MDPATPAKAPRPYLNAVTSTPSYPTSNQRTDSKSPVQPVCEGCFVGQAKHKDGSHLGIIFQVGTMYPQFALLGKYYLGGGYMGPKG